MSYSQATSLRYPLRPGKLSAMRYCGSSNFDKKTEFVESTWYLYRVRFARLGSNGH